MTNICQAPAGAVEGSVTVVMIWLSVQVQAVQEQSKQGV
jgi:hypothetical protein